MAGMNMYSFLLVPCLPAGRLVSNNIVFNVLLHLDLAFGTTGACARNPAGTLIFRLKTLPSFEVYFDFSAKKC
jgi:hypothetical protein